MRRIAALLAVATALFANTSVASQLIYLSCDLPAQDDSPVAHFDFTLDEQNGTVSYYVKEANASNKEKAVFGPGSITWVNNMAYGTKLSRTISRTDLSFVQETVIAGNQTRRVGVCSLVSPEKRKF